MCMVFLNSDGGNHNHHYVILVRCPAIPNFLGKKY